MEEKADTGRIVSAYKGAGYVSSTVSVALLGAVSWQSASESPLMLALLVLGMSTSVFGMLLRWISHRKDQKQKEHMQ